MRIIKVASGGSGSLKRKVLKFLEFDSQFPNFIGPFLQDLQASWRNSASNTELSKKVYDFFCRKRAAVDPSSIVMDFLNDVKSYIDNYQIPPKIDTDPKSIQLVDRGYLPSDLTVEWNDFRNIVIRLGEVRSEAIKRYNLSEVELNELKNVFDSIKTKNENEVINLINEFKSMIGGTPKYRKIKTIIDNLEAAGRINSTKIKESAGSFHELSGLFMGIGLENFSSTSSSVIGRKKQIKQFVDNLIWQKNRGTSSLGLEDYRSEQTSGLTIDRSNPDAVYNELLKNLSGFNNVTKSLGVALFLSIFGHDLEKAAIRFDT